MFWNVDIIEWMIQANIDFGQRVFQPSLRICYISKWFFRRVSGRGADENRVIYIMNLCKWIEEMGQR